MSSTPPNCHFCGEPSPLTECVDFPELQPQRKPLCYQREIAALKKRVGVMHEALEAIETQPPALDEPVATEMRRLAISALNRSIP